MMKTSLHSVFTSRWTTYKSSWIVGFVVATTHMTYPWWDKNVKFWCEIEGLHVHHDLWRKRIGTQLVNEASNYARSKGVEAAYVVSREDNISVRRLYGKAGFKNHEHKIRHKLSLDKQ